jgi:hypothetical protein
MPLNNLTLYGSHVRGFSLRENAHVRGENGHVQRKPGPKMLNGVRGRGRAIWRVSPPPTPPHNVADLRESVPSKSSAATLRGGGARPDP